MEDQIKKIIDTLEHEISSVSNDIQQTMNEGDNPSPEVCSYLDGLNDALEIVKTGVLQWK